MLQSAGGDRKVHLAEGRQIAAPQEMTEKQTAFSSRPGFTMKMTETIVSAPNGNAPMHASALPMYSL
jgi:hypothetical protein